MKVFRYGKFYDYDETYADYSWSYTQILKAASFFATCKHYKYDENLSYSLSSMYVFMEIEPEMKYDKSYMDILECIKGRVETA